MLRLTVVLHCLDRRCWAWINDWVSKGALLWVWEGLHHWIA